MKTDNGSTDTSSIDIDRNRRWLNRYRFVEHEGLRILSGWLPQCAIFELKCEIGRAIWEDAQHVNSLYRRLREIQSPAFQTPADNALVRLMTEMWHAPGEVALTLAFWRVLKPELCRALRAHEAATFPNSDLPSVYAIQHILHDEDAQADRVKLLLDQFEREERIDRAVLEWEQYMRGLLAAAGGITGQDSRGEEALAPPAVRREFVLPREAARDPRFTNLGADPAPVPEEAEYASHTVEEFERYSTEMLAAETVALVIASRLRMPWEFELDSARHLYDEVRHCLMGYEWMRRHGMDPFQSPQYLHIFRWRSQFDPVMQYCLLTMGNEVNAFPYRHRRVEAHLRAGDALSEQFVRYDIADETQHVRFGKRWLPEMLKQQGESQLLEEYVKHALQLWESEYKTGRLSELKPVSN